MWAVHTRSKAGVPGGWAMRWNGGCGHNVQDGVRWPGDGTGAVHEPNVGFGCAVVRAGGGYGMG